MKRTSASIEYEEKRLSKLLFKNKTNLIDKLEATDKCISELKPLPPAWKDEDDDLFTTNQLLDTKNKDLYVNTLKQKYVNLMGTPTWAKLDKLKSEDDDDAVLRKVGHLQNKTSPHLPKDFLEIKKFPKINSETNNEGPIINCIEFHPTASVALVGGQSGIVSLFSVGGDTNNKLHTFRLKRLSLLSAHFTPDGTEAYIALKKTHSYCVYNLMKAEAKLVELPRIVKKATIFELSSDGNFLAVSDSFDEIYLICTKSKELIKQLKHNFNIVSVVFSHNVDKLYALGTAGEVCIWNLTSYRIENKFYDQGCVNASCMTASSCGKLLAIGSNEGIVNIYESANLNMTEPTPVKSIENLRTKITNLKFNCSTEILAMASSFHANAVKLLHLPSYHVFPNFPMQSTNLHQVGTVTFSPNSGYMALSNNKNCAYMYRLKHYKNY